MRFAFVCAMVLAVSSGQLVQVEVTPRHGRLAGVRLQRFYTVPSVEVATMGSPVWGCVLRGSWEEAHSLTVVAKKPKNPTPADDLRLVVDFVRRLRRIAL